MVFQRLRSPGFVQRTDLDYEAVGAHTGVNSPAPTPAIFERYRRAIHHPR